MEFFRTLTLRYRCPNSVKFIIALAAVALVVTACATIVRPEPEAPETAEPAEPAPYPERDRRDAMRPGSLYSELEAEIARWPEFAEAAASITFDDGTRDQYLVAAPVLERHDVRATFFLISHKMDRGVWVDQAGPRRLMSWREAARLADAGHEIGSHGATHVDLSRNDVNLELELDASRTQIERRLPGVTVRTLSWPYWRSTPEAREHASETGYIAARGGAAIPDQFRNLQETEMLNVPAMGLRPADPAEEWDELAAEAVANGGWMVYALHGLDNGSIPDMELGWEPIPDSELERIITRLQARDVWIAPFGEVAAYKQLREMARVHLEPLSYDRVRVSLRADHDADELPPKLTVRLAAEGTLLVTRDEDNRGAEADLPAGSERSAVVSLRPNLDSVVIERRGR